MHSEAARTGPFVFPPPPPKFQVRSELKGCPGLPTTFLFLFSSIISSSLQPHRLPICFLLHSQPRNHATHLADVPHRRAEHFSSAQSGAIASIILPRDRPLFVLFRT